MGLDLKETYTYHPSIAHVHTPFAFCPKHVSLSEKPLMDGGIMSNVAEIWVQ